MTATALPTEQTPIKMDSELSEVVSGFLEELEGDEQEVGKEAVRAIYNSGFSGSFGELVERYRSGISEAVGFDVGDPPEEVAEIGEEAPEA